jgi:plastocyanin
MKHHVSLALSFAALLGFSALLPTEASAQWGTLKGKFVIDGAAPKLVNPDVNKDVEVCGKHMLVNEELLVDAGGGIANVVVYVRTKGVQVHPDVAAAATKPVVYDNKGCRFEPHILGVMVGQPVILKNSDPVGHNSNVQPIGDQGVNPLIPSGGEIEHKFNRSQFVPVSITCNIHPWMKGYVLPRENPYIAVSGKDGTIELKNLPVGELEFQAWHEKSGYLATSDWDKGRFKLTIKDGDNSLGDKKIPVALFQK